MHFLRVMIQTLFFMAALRIQETQNSVSAFMLSNWDERYFGIVFIVLRSE